MPLGKFLGAIVAEDWEITMQRTDAPPGAVRTLTIPDGIYYLSGDGTASDLIDVLEDLAHAFAELANFNFILGSDGVASMNGAAGQQITITWTAAGVELRNMLRYSGATLVLVGATPELGDWPAGHTMFFTKTFAVDRPSRVPQAGQVRPDTGNVQTDCWAQNKDITVRFKFRGPRRSSAWEQYHSLETFWQDVVAPGLPFRYYPDVGVTTPFVAVTNPWGYETWVALGPPPFEAQEYIPGVGVWFEAEWRLAENV